MWVKNSDATNTSEMESDAATVFPNPTLGKIFIDVNNFDKIELININGGVMLSTRDNQNLDISNYPAGIILVQIITNNQTKCYKVLKQ